MFLKTHFLIFTGLIILLACENNTPKDKDIIEKSNPQKEKPQAHTNLQTIAKLITGNDSIFISKKVVLEDWDQQWSNISFEFYDEQEGVQLIHWQQAINDQIRNSLFRPEEAEPYPRPLNATLVKKSLKAFKKEANRYEEDMVWSSTDTFDISDHYSSFACLKSFNSSYTGGAHGMYGVSFDYFDKTNGKKLTIKDFLNVDQKLLKIAEIAFRKKVGLKPNVPFNKDEYWFGKRFYLPDNFEITSKGITFFYNPYEVTNWANGIVEFSLTHAQLSTFLKLKID